MGSWGPWGRQEGSHGGNEARRAAGVGERAHMAAGLTGVAGQLVQQRGRGGCGRLVQQWVEAAGLVGPLGWQEGSCGGRQRQQGLRGHGRGCAAAARLTEPQGWQEDSHSGGGLAGLWG